MAEIRLTHGVVAIVDDELYPSLSQFKWYAQKSASGSFYAARNIPQHHRRRKTIYMSREITGCPDGFDVDHANGNTLDNRRENLRICTRSQNKANAPRYANNKSGFKGAFWNKTAKQWSAQICIHQKIIHLGCHPTREAAARAYDEAAKRYFGQFAKTNFQNDAK